MAVVVRGGDRSTAPDPSWGRLYRAGAGAASLAVVAYLAALVLFVATPAPPEEGGAATLEHVAAHRTAYLVKQVLWVGPNLLMVVVVGPQAALHQVVHRTRQVGRHFLRQPPVNRAGRPEHVATVRLHVAHDDLHQGGLARAVAPEQADALAGFDLEVDLFQDRRAAEVQRDVEQVEQLLQRARVEVARWN